MHVGVSRCPVTYVLLSRGAPLSRTFLCLPLCVLCQSLLCLSFVRDDTTQWTELKLQSQRGGRVSCASGEELAGASRSAAVSLKEHPVKNSLK